MEFYKKYRPDTLSKVVGCDATTRGLAAFLASETLPHAILFHGPSGCGKTTLARIVKDELNCHDLDFREVNSSSFRGVDSVRDIQKVMGYAPCAGKVRVWLLDEVHKLTNDAQNAALKMLEDTPGHVYFFLCTTDPTKLIKALRGRCTEMPVAGLTRDDLGGVVDRVAKKEKVELASDVRDAIVDSSDGSPRVALVLLEKIAALAPADREAAVAEKAAELNECIDLCRLLIKKAPWKAVTAVLANLKGEPEDVRRGVAGYARSVLLKEANHQAYLVADCFSRNFYDSGNVGLVVACFEAVHGGK